MWHNNTALCYYSNFLKKKISPITLEWICSLLLLFFFLSGWMITKLNEMGQLMAVPLTKLLNYVETLSEVYRTRRICSEVIKLLTRAFRQQTDGYSGFNTLKQTSNQTLNSFINFSGMQHARQCTRKPFRPESVMLLYSLLFQICLYLEVVWFSTIY